MDAPGGTLDGTAQSTLSEAIELLAELVYPNPLERPENAAQRLMLVHEDYPANIPLFTRFLTTGTFEARNHARLLINGVLALLNDSMTPDELDDPEDFQEAYYPLSTINIRRIWNMTNVLSECGFPEEGRWDKIYQLGVMETIHTCLDPEQQGYPETDEYWRGTSLLSLTGIEPVVSDVPGFVEWAGASSDPKGVLDAAMERESLHIPTLIGVMSERSMVAVPLRNGAL